MSGNMTGPWRPHRAPRSISPAEADQNRLRPQPALPPGRGALTGFPTIWGAGRQGM